MTIDPLTPALNYAQSTIMGKCLMSTSIWLKGLERRAFLLDMLRAIFTLRLGCNSTAAIQKIDEEKNTTYAKITIGDGDKWDFPARHAAG